LTKSRANTSLSGKASFRRSNAATSADLAEGLDHRIHFVQAVGRQVAVARRPVRLVVPE
jgi:hypothetical protein